MSKAHHVEPGLPMERRARLRTSRSETRSIATNPTVKAQPASRSSSNASHPRPNACATASASHLCHPYAYRPSSMPQSHRSLTRLLCHPYASRSPFGQGGQGLGSHRQIWDPERGIGPQTQVAELETMGIQWGPRHQFSICFWVLVMGVGRRSCWVNRAKFRPQIGACPA